MDTETEVQRKIIGDLVRMWIGKSIGHVSEGDSLDPELAMSCENDIRDLFKTNVTGLQIIDEEFSSIWSKALNTFMLESDE